MLSSLPCCEFINVFERGSNRLIVAAIWGAACWRVQLGVLERLRVPMGPLGFLHVPSSNLATCLETLDIINK